MKILDVLIEYGNSALNRTFSYLYDGDKRVEKGFRVLIQFSAQKKSIVGFVMSVAETSQSLEELETSNGYAMRFIEDVLDEEPLLSDELMQLAEQVSSYYMAPLITVLQAMLPKTLAPRRSSLKGPKIAYDTYVRALSFEEEGLTAKQIEVIRNLRDNGEVLKKEAGSAAILDKLLEKGRIVFIKKERLRRPEIIYSEKEVSHPLTNEQRQAYQTILGTEKEVILLQGVTGSGKTEVYLHLSEQVLREGKSVLMLVPEINLTPAMVDYFARRFGMKVAILHSELTPGERYDEYRRIARGDAQIVVGARSAVFAPLSNIGLIILDEEHVESYKQDNRPYYHAREVAIMRGKMLHAKVVLGSATPSLETKARAMKGVYGYAELKHRVNAMPLPKTEIIDLRDRANIAPNSQKLSAPLLAKLSECLREHKQAIILINRRGYWTNIICASCGHYFSCPSCGGNLTYHSSDQMLKCHHCGHVELFPKRCPNCGSSRLMRTGYGTERIVKELEDIFPTARVARLDSDVTKIGKNLGKTLIDFHNQEYDFLIGTQMIAKGHDFPAVTLSAVALADIGLTLPSYRAAERTFELIAQAVGRSGRNRDAGTALIQTYNPDHYAIRYGASQDYESFFLREMKERKVAQYPPFVYLMLLTFKGNSEEKVILASKDFKRLIDMQSFDGVTILGPISPYYAMVDGKYIRNVLIKFKKREQLCDYVSNLVSTYSGKGGIDISINIDPLDY